MTRAGLQGNDDSVPVLQPEHQVVVGSLPGILVDRTVST
jgi:hypothetical protein